MALFGMRIKKRYKTSVGGFHAEYLDKPAARRRSKPMGLGRTFGSALSLMIGGFMCYTALHYIPAYLGTHKFLAMTQIDDSASRLIDDGSQRATLMAYLDFFKIKRAYLRPGQSIQAQYSLPEGATLDLYIRQCRPAFIIEIFDCQIVNEKAAKVINDKIGTQRFMFQDKGFYLFDERVTLPSGKAGKYRVVWSRT